MEAFDLPSKLKYSIPVTGVNIVRVTSSLRLSVVNTRKHFIHLSRRDGRPFIIDPRDSETRRREMAGAHARTRARARASAFSTVATLIQ